MTAPTQKDVEDSFAGTVTSVLAKNEQLRRLLRNVVAQLAIAGTEVPTGGTTGQALLKASDADYDVEWADAGGDPTQEQILEILANLDENAVVATSLSALNVVAGNVTGEAAWLGNAGIEFFAANASDYRDMYLYAKNQSFYTGLTGTALALFLNEDGNAEFGFDVNVVGALSVDGTPIGESPIRESTVTLTAADLAVLDTVPFELVPAPGAGKVLGVCGMYSSMKLNGGLWFTVDDTPQPYYLNKTFGYGATDTGVLSGSFGSSVDLYGQIPYGVAIAHKDISLIENINITLNSNSSLGVPGAIATSSIGAAGTGYVALETVTRGNATIRIDTVGGGGEVLTYTVTVAGTNNIVGAAQATTGGSGADFTIDIDTVDVSVNPMTLTVKTLYSVMDVV